MKSEHEIIEEMQQVVEQMRIDDIEDNPDIANEYFDCDCCGEQKCLAGSIDCVLIAETGFALGKIKSVQELIDAVEDKNLEKLCEYLRQEQLREKN